MGAAPAAAVDALGDAVSKPAVRAAPAGPAAPTAGAACRQRAVAAAATAAEAWVPHPAARAALGARATGGRRAAAGRATMGPWFDPAGRSASPERMARGHWCDPAFRPAAPERMAMGQRAGPACAGATTGRAASRLRPAAPEHHPAGLVAVGREALPGPGADARRGPVAADRRAAGRATVAVRVADAAWLSRCRGRSSRCRSIDLHGGPAHSSAGVRPIAPERRSRSGPTATAGRTARRRGHPALRAGGARGDDARPILRTRMALGHRTGSGVRGGPARVRVADRSAPVGTATSGKLRHTAGRTARRRAAAGVATRAGDSIPARRRSPTGARGPDCPTAAWQSPATGLALRGRYTCARVAARPGHSPAAGRTSHRRPNGIRISTAARNSASRRAATAARGNAPVRCRAPARGAASARDNATAGAAVRARGRAAGRELGVAGIFATGGRLVRFLFGTSGELAVAGVAEGARDPVPRRGARRGGASPAAADACATT
jgi:hypothetical protein